jgi:hypothetical protein
MFFPIDPIIFSLFSCFPTFHWLQKASLFFFFPPPIPPLGSQWSFFSFLPASPFFPVASYGPSFPVSPTYLLARGYEKAALYGTSPPFLAPNPFGPLFASLYPRQFFPLPSQKLFGYLCLVPAFPLSLGSRGPRFLFPSHFLHPLGSKGPPPFFLSPPQHVPWAPRSPLSSFPRKRKHAVVTMSL